MPFNDPAVFGRFNDDAASADAVAVPVNFQGPALKPCTAFDTFSFGWHIYLLNIIFHSRLNLFSHPFFHGRSSLNTMLFPAGLLVGQVILRP
jgi:hypothetical protein